MNNLFSRFRGALPEGGEGGGAGLLGLVTKAALGLGLLGWGVSNSIFNGQCVRVWWCVPPPSP